MSGVNYREFSAKIKSKYPQYANVDDFELAKKIVEKYPEYSDQVLFDEVPTDEESVRRAKEDVYGVSYKPEDTAPDDNRIPSADNLPETLSYKEGEKEAVPNYFGLFDKKGVVDTANKLGVSVGFFDKVGEAASQAEYAPEKLYEAFEIKQKAEALKKHFPEVTAEADSILSDLVGTSPNKLEDISARVSALEGAVASYVEEQPTWPYRGYINDTYDDPLSMATKRMIENTKNLKKAATEDATTAGRVIRGTGKGIQQYVEGFTKIVQEMASNRAVVEINDKLGRVANGEDVKFTDQERMFLQVMVDNVKIQDEYGKRIGISYKIGEAFGQSLGFMAEFVMTGGLASGATKLGHGAKVVSKAVQIGRATKVGKVATNMAIKAAQAGVQTLGMPSFYQKVAIGVSNGETFGGALLDSYWQMWAENMSERIFMSKIVPGKEGANVLDRMLGRMGTTITTEKGALGVLKSTLEESAEEKIGEILTAPKDFDNFSEFWKSFTDVEQNKIMLGSVSLMTGLMGSPAVALNAYDKVSTGIKVDQLRSVLDADITGGIDKIYSEKDLNAKDAMSLVFDLIDGKIKQLPRDTNYPQVVSDALRYAQLKAKQTAMAGLTEKEFNELLKEKQGKIEPVVEPVEETPELTEQQKQIDYLKSRGQVIPDGTDMETLNKMFSAEKTKERTEVNTEIDTKVKAAQEKLGLPQTPDIEISDDTEATLDRLDEGLPVTNEFIKAASQELYDRYKELEAMKTSDTRLYTTEQIESMQGYLGEEIERLENYASEQKETGEFVSEVKVGEVAKGKAEGVAEGVSGVVGEPQKPVETVSKESGQIVPAEEKAAVKPSEEAVAGNIKNGRVRTVLPVEKPDTYLEYNGKRIHELDEIEDLLANGDDSWAYSEGKSGLKRAINDEMPYWRESPNAELLLKQANWLLDKIDNGEVTQVKSSFVELIGDKEKTIKNDFIKGKLGRIVKSIDESLSGKLKRAIDSWLGVTTDMKKSGIITGVMNESPLENLYASEPTIIEEAMAETKSHLREKYGDTITLYRSEDVDFGKRSKRTLLSYTSDPLVADFFYKAGKTNLIKEEIPIDDIVWVTDRMNQSEFIVKSEGVEDAVQVKEAGRVPVQPAPGVGEKVEGRAPEAKPEEVAGEKKEVKEKRPVVTADDFIAKLKKKKKDNPNKYWSVDVPTKKEIEDGTIIDVDGGRAVVSPDGNLIGVHAIDESRKGVAAKIIEKAKTLGVKKLDVYDGYLVGIYAKNGFREVARVPFNEEFAPNDMPESEKKKKPDVVFMVFDPKAEMKVKARRFKSSDEAKAYVDSYITEEPVVDHNKSSETQAFFSDVVTGKSEKYVPKRKWNPLLVFDEAQKKVLAIYEKFNGKFDEHIATSIPAFRDVQIKVISAILSLTNGKSALMYDIGGSEGGFAKTVTSMSNGKVKSVNLDANTDMQNAHNATPVKGSEFVREAFGEGFEYDGVKYERHVPKKKADIVHESMTFQFIDEKRSDKLDELVSNYLKPDGLFITEEKVHPKTKEQWDANEKVKDEKFKTQYYDESQIDKKREEVLTGMKKNQTTYERYRNELLKRFDYVEEYWDGGNFKGIVASNDKAKVDEFLKAVGNTESIYSEKNISVERAKEKKDEVQKEEKGLRNEKVNKRFRKISKQTGTDAKTVERMYNTLMDVFGLSQDKALAGAVIVDRMVGTMAKRTNKTKDQVYATIKWEKGGAIAEMAGVKQDVLGKARGATMFMDDANAVIMALTDPNVTTPLHELTHVYEKYLTAKEKEQILKWTGEKSWSVNTSESFARGAERFLYDGTAPGNLKAIFQKFAAWLKDIYKTLVASEINIALNEDMRRIYSTMLGSEYVEEKVPSQAPETAEEAADAFFGSAPVDADGNIILSDEEIADEFFSGLEVDENGVIKFQFIGATGAARLDAAENNNNRIFNLREAMKMTDANKTAEEIKLATGWEKGKDKRWRYEIPDNMKMRTAWDKLKVSDFNDKYELPITEAMDYPELFAAYPELEKIKIRKDTAFLDIFQSVQGWYDHDSMELVVSPNAIDPFGTILHELQHAVQMVEGFATGTNTEAVIAAIPDFEFESVVDQLVEQLERDIKKNTEKNLIRRKILSGLTEKEEADIRRYSKEIIAAGEEGDRLYKEEKKKFPDKNPFLDNKKLAELRQVKYELRDKINDIIERIIGERSITLAIEFAYGIEAVEEAIEETTNQIIEDNKSIKEINGGADRSTIIKNFGSSIGDMAYNYYKRVAGETEARNVAARAKLTPEQRRSTAESTEDIPRDQQIVMRGGKIVSMDLGKMTVVVDGKNRPVLNSEGRPIHNTEEGIINFWKWFGDSKVVDAQGRPLVVYHGTNGDFDEFSGRKGYYFTPDKNYEFLTNRNSVIPSYIKSENPYVTDDWYIAESAAYTDIIDEIIKRGYDGIESTSSTKPGFHVAQYVVFSPHQIKSATGNVGTFSPETGNILFQEPKTERQKGVELLANIGRKGVIRPAAEKLIRDWLATKQYKVDESLIKDALDSLTFTTVSPIGFYSTVENALTKISQSKGTPEQFKAMLLNNGAKQAEMDWMGWDEFISGKKSITKTEVQEWIDQNKIEVEEVEKGLADLEWEQSGNTYKYGDYEIEKSETSGKYIVYHKDGGGFIGGYSNIDGAKNFVEAQLSVGEKRILTEYSQYVTPGGKNYKELLLTMPGKPISLTVEEREQPFGKRWFVINNEGKIASEPFLSKSDAEVAAKRIHEIRTGSSLKEFSSAHWDEPNILAHIRFDERVTPDGEKVLFIEEIQSDWAQKGKKEGFKGDTTYDAVLEEENVWNVGGVKVLYFERGVDGKNYRTINKNSEQVWFKTLDDAVKQANNTVSNLSEKEIFKVPDMPFKKTDQWLNLAARRMMRYAAENGFDRIAWTTGEQQAERYDLSKQVDKVAYSKTQSGKIEISVRNKNMAGRTGEWNFVGEYTQQELPDIVGKDLAEKISKDSETKNKKEYSGLDLKVGGEGMKAFYDKIIPAAVSKLGKPFNAKVESTNIRNIDINTFQETPYYAVQSISITQTMRESAMEGMPLFQAPKSKRDIAVDMLYGLIRNETSKEAARARIDAYLTSRGWKLGVDGGNIVAEAIARLGLSETVVEAPVRPTKRGTPSERVVAERPLSGKVKESKLGIRVIDGESAMPQNIKTEIMKGNLHKYDVFPDEVADATAAELYRANGLDGSIALFYNEEHRLHAKLEVFLGAYIVEGMNREISRAEKDGRIGDANYWSKRMVDFAGNYIEKVSVERAQGLAALNSARVQSLFPSRAFLMKYEQDVSETRKAAMDTRTFKRKVKQVKADGKKAHKEVINDVLEDLNKKLGAIKEGASLRDMMKQKKALLDELKARRKNPPKMQMTIPSIPGLDPMDVAYGASIASVYIQAGVYGEKLVKGLVKDFKSIDIDITEEQAEKMVPDVINVGGVEVSVDDFLDELEGKKEAMRLANRIFGAITPKKESKDPLTMMLNTLMAKFNERNLNKPERKKISDIEKIGEAIRDKEHYSETWTEARKIALDMIEANEEMDVDQKEIMTGMINDAYDKATAFTYSERQVDRAIRAKMKDMGMVLADIVRAHFDVQVRNRGSLTEALIIDANIDRADAEMLARSIERRYDSLMSEHGRRLIKKYTQHLTPTQKKSVGRRSEEERLLELINIGAFDDPSFVDAFASARGLVTIDPVHVRNIKAKAEEINKQKSRVLRLKKTEDLLGYMANIQGVSLAEIGDAVWYASVLSGMSTQVRNVMGGSAGVGINLATEMFFHPSYVPAMMRGIWRGIKFGKEKAEDVLKYGYSPYETRVETPRVVERLKLNPKAFTIPMIAHVFNNLKYVSRIMAAADMFNVSVGKEAWAELLALENLRLNDKKVSGLDYMFDSKYRKQIRSAINTFLGVTKEQIDAIRAEVEADAIELGYTETDKKIAIIEGIEMLRPGALVEVSTTMAVKSTGNTRTYGMIGFVTDRLADVMKGVALPFPEKTKTGEIALGVIHPFKYVAAFTKIVSNVGALALEYVPFAAMPRYVSGAAGAAFKPGGSLSKIMPMYGKYYHELSETERKAVLHRQIVGMVFTAAMVMLSDPGDDDDPIIQITADGTGDWNKNNSLKDWKPYSLGIKVGDKRVWVPFRYTPLILALAPIGWARDRMKYSEKHKDAPFASMLTRGYTYMPSFLADMTAIQSMNEMLNNLFTSKFTAKIANVFEPEEGIERTQMDKFKSDISSILMDVLGSFRTTLEGFYTPGVYRDMVKIWENLTQKELEMPANELKKLWARNPISVLDRRPEGIVYRDVLGRPTTRPWFLSEFLSVTDKEDIMTYHTDNAEPLGGVDMKRSTLPIYEGGKLVIRKINPGDAKDAELWDYYVERRGYYLLRGTSISEEQLLGIEALKAHGVKGEEYQKAVTKLDGYAKKAAKEDVMWMSQFDLNYIRSQRGR